MNVLLINDDRKGGHLLQECFSATGIQLLLANDDASAIRQLERQEVSAVLVDVGQEQSSQSSYDLCQKIQAQLSVPVPIIMLTGPLKLPEIGSEAGTEESRYFPAELISLLRSLPSDC